MTTVDFITELFCQVDDPIGYLPKHKQATLYSSEVVTLAMLYALTGKGNRAFWRWLSRDYWPLFPKLPDRTRLFRLFNRHRPLIGEFLYYDPQVEVIRRYTKLAGGQILPVTYQGPGYDVEDGARTVPSVENVPYLDVVAVRNAQGETEIALVSRHDREAIPVELALDGNEERELLSCEIMTAEGTTSTNTPLVPDRVTFMETELPASDGTRIQLRIEPRSITWLRLK